MTLVLLLTLAQPSLAQDRVPIGSVVQPLELDDVGEWVPRDPASEAWVGRDGLRRPATAGHELFGSDLLITEQARLEVQREGDEFTVYEDTKVVFEDWGLRHEVGAVLVRVSSAFTVRWGSTEAVVEGTEFVSSALDGAFDIRVAEGAVRVKNELGEVLVVPGEVGVVEAGKAPDKRKMTPEEQGRMPGQDAARGPSPGRRTAPDLVPEPEPGPEPGLEPGGPGGALPGGGVPAGGLPTLPGGPGLPASGTAIAGGGGGGAPAPGASAPSAPTPSAPSPTTAGAPAASAPGASPEPADTARAEPASPATSKPPAAPDSPEKAEPVPVAAASPEGPATLPAPVAAGEDFPSLVWLGVGLGYGAQVDPEQAGARARLDLRGRFALAGDLGLTVGASVVNGTVTSHFPAALGLAYGLGPVDLGAEALVAAGWEEGSDGGQAGWQVRPGGAATATFLVPLGKSGALTSQVLAGWSTGLLATATVGGGLRW